MKKRERGGATTGIIIILLILIIGGYFLYQSMRKQAGVIKAEQAARDQESQGLELDANVSGSVDTQ